MQCYKLTCKSGLIHILLQMGLYHFSHKCFISSYSSKQCLYAANTSSSSGLRKCDTPNITKWYDCTDNVQIGCVFKSDHETAILTAPQLGVPSIFCFFISKRFIHSIGMCKMRQFLAVLRSFFHSSLLCTFSCHTSPPTILPSSLTSSCHLLLGLPLNLVVPIFIYNTLLGILFFSILCTRPNQHIYLILVSRLQQVFNTCIIFFIG